MVENTVMIIDPHTYAEGFIQEDEVKKSARARGEEIGAIDTTCGTGFGVRLLIEWLRTL